MLAKLLKVKTQDKGGTASNHILQAKPAKLMAVVVVPGYSKTGWLRWANIHLFACSWSW